mmetsp:Transcript_2297/g.8196  ORF Transcript_2297/g.8196 Transcript_2297/m.8196 type:complete len:277 (-) Transcript_2297:115-945(-)
MLGTPRAFGTVVSRLRTSQDCRALLVAELPSLQMTRRSRCVYSLLLLLMFSFPVFLFRTLLRHLCPRRRPRRPRRRPTSRDETLSFSFLRYFCYFLLSSRCRRLRTTQAPVGTADARESSSSSRVEKTMRTIAKKKWERKTEKTKKAVGVVDFLLPLPLLLLRSLLPSSPFPSSPTVSVSTSSFLLPNRPIRAPRRLVRSPVELLLLRVSFPLLTTTPLLSRSTLDKTCDTRSLFLTLVSASVSVATVSAGKYLRLSLRSLQVRKPTSKPCRLFRA